MTNHELGASVKSFRISSDDCCQGSSFRLHQANISERQRGAVGVFWQIGIEYINVATA